MDTSNEHMHIEQKREETVAAVVKNRAHRRAHGQRGTASAPVAKHRSRGQRTETGAQRAARRAAARGLRVGYPVRAQIGLGANYGPRWTLERGEQRLVPLEFGERISNYRIQQAVRTHHVGGTNWRPTPRQRRRLDHKARHAAAPFKRLVAIDPYPVAPVPFDRLYLNDVVRADDPASVRMEELTEQRRAPMIEQRSGFRVMDRRGEHG